MCVCVCVSLTTGSFKNNLQFLCLDFHGKRYAYICFSPKMWDIHLSCCTEVLTKMLHEKRSTALHTLQRKHNLQDAPLQSLQGQSATCSYKRVLLRNAPLQSLPPWGQSNTLKQLQKSATFRNYKLTMPLHSLHK